MADVHGWRATLRSWANQAHDRIAGSTGLEGEAGAAALESARELREAARRPWRVRATRRAIGVAVVRGLDRMASVVASSPAPIEDIDTLDQYAGRTRHGVTAALTVVQGTLFAGAAATDGGGGPPAVVLDAGVAQVASVLTGLAEWYFVGSYTVFLLRRAQLSAEPHELRRIVNAAMLSRFETIDPDLLDPGAEGRLILRWIGRGVADVVPLVSGLPTQRVRRAGRRLEGSDLGALLASLRQP
ncbi:MAG TPA: hypothetical protein VGI06_00750 [Acidimicrobiales bacterium]